MNTDKRIVLAEVQSDELRAALERIPGAYFQVARETVTDPSYVNDVLWRIVALYGDAVKQKERRADALEAQLAEQRRGHLRIVDPEWPADPAADSQHIPMKGAS